ncbi:hypothetical protein ABGB12_27140 [Actinocorallia sp. B10E7]|uniref:hypothetical protein n=1 Tax=Actinocorallia sp. B10E7 TaxID=3153558 RepID=UPI00325D14FE
MGDEVKLHRPQAVQAGSPAPTPASVDMEQVKSIISAVDIANVTQTGELYLKMAARFDEHAANLVAHAEAIAGIWRGKPADSALDAMAKLHNAATTISANTTEAGNTYQWLGTTILPFYKDSAQDMTDGFVRTDSDDERARELLDRMNDRVTEANNGLPSQLVVTLPVVDSSPRKQEENWPGNPVASSPYGPYDGGNGPNGDYGSWAPEQYDDDPYGGNPGGTGPGGPSYPDSGGPKMPGGPGNPEIPSGPGGTTPNGPGGSGVNVIGNDTDLAGTGPNPGPGTGQNPFNLNPTGPGNGLPSQPAGPSPYGPGGYPGLTGPGGGPTTRGPSGLSTPRTGLPQSPGGPGRGVIGAANGESALARNAAQQMAARGQAGMPIGGARGGGAGGDGEEHTRTTWLSEDEEVWGGDADVPPAVIG